MFLCRFPIIGSITSRLRTNRSLLLLLPHHCPTLPLQRGQSSLLRLLLRPTFNKYNKSLFFSTSAYRRSKYEMVSTTDRISAVRKLMSEHKVDVLIVPSEDAHQSEYIAPCDGRREYICGFTGSAGCAVITQDKAVLSTDGRYFNQAEKQLDSNWHLLKQGLPDVPTWQEWTYEQAEGGKTVGVDATLLTSADARKLKDKLKAKGGGELVGMDTNLIDKVWESKRPERPANPVMVLDEKFAGKSYQEKLEDVRKDLEKKNSCGLILSGLDEIMWLFNIRGSDIPYNPVFFSYAIVTPDEATLFANSSQLNDRVKEHLSSIQIKPYDSIFSELSTLSAKIQSGEGQKKFMLANTASWALAKAIGEDKLYEVKSPITNAKAIKNETELKGMKECHIRDGAALIQYFAWLEDKLASGAKMDEVQASDQLEKFRSEKEHFVGLSFPTISSTGANAAIIHYHPEPGTEIDPKAIYLCDSGAQFFDGTTDTTRTLHFGEPTDMEKKAYTLVLKGNVSLGKAVFPKGTSGFALDTLARQYLWAEGLDYRHGTGHGVGSFLNVHEGPIGIGTRVQYSEVPLSAGNVISNEPGYYEDGSFGIRIENIIIVKEMETNHKFGEKPYFGFETVTMVPMCRKLINMDMLTSSEKTYLNEYHDEVYEKTIKFFEGDEKTISWLKRETAPY